jgi:predicted lipid-binding transport protein (Tim44 family)
MRRTAWIAPLSALLVLGLAEVALAQAGGGSSGFGGGGGGGGFGGGGGGGFGGGGGSGSTGSPVVLLLFFGGFAIFLIYLTVHSARYRRKVRERDARVRTASAEAAEDDAYFGADYLVPYARSLFLEAQSAWDARDRERLAKVVGEDLMIEWSRRLDDFDSKGWHNRVEVLDEPQIQYVGLVNREDDEEDRAVVRITARLRAYVIDSGGRRIMRKGEKGDQITLTEYWTLARRGDGWFVASIEQRAEGDHHLEGEIIASPWSDTQRLGDESLTELAVADGLPEGFTTSDLAELEFSGDAQARALDLSLADARFMPALLEAAARRAVAAWVEAVDGSDDALLAVASPDAVQALLYGGDASRRTRLVVRGARVRHIRIASLQVEREPATMTIVVEVGGRRYVEDRDTAAVLSGSKDSATTFTETWTLALDGPDDAPWRLVSAAGTVSPR